MGGAKKGEPISKKISCKMRLSITRTSPVADPGISGGAL